MSADDEPDTFSDEENHTLDALADWLRSEPERWPMMDENRMSDERMSELTERIITERGPAARRRRRRRRAKVAAMPVVVLALAAAGWAVALRGHATDAMSFSCEGPEVTSIVANDGTSPIDACRELWESGAMVQGVTSAPPLAACLLEETNVMVVEAEGDDGCAGVEGEPWADQPEYEAIGRAITNVRIHLHERYESTGDGCATEQDWTTGLRSHPDTDGWTIEVERTDPDHGCFDVSEADPTSRRIVLQSSAGDYSIGCDPRTGC